MSSAKPYPAVSELKDRFEIAGDGVTLIWKNPQQKRMIGRPVGVTITEKGYARIMWGKRPLFLHRVLWKMQTGFDPKGQIDHINGNKLDNRSENLRDASHAENQRSASPRGGKSKFKGVYEAKCKNKWGARIKVNGKTIHLGTYKNEIEAAMAYDEKAKELHGAFCSTNSALGLY